MLQYHNIKSNLVFQWWTLWFNRRFRRLHRCVYSKRT